MWGRTGIAENAGGQSTEYRDRIRQTPRTGDNDCDVGTYRQVRPTFPIRTDAKTMNGSFHIERCPQKTRRKGKTGYPGGCILIGQMGVSGQRTHLAVRPYIRHRGKRRRAVNGMQGYSLSLHKTGGSPAMASLKTLFSSCHCTRLSLSLHPKKFVHELYPDF